MKREGRIEAAYVAAPLRPSLATSVGDMVLAGLVVSLQDGPVKLARCSACDAEGRQ